MLICYRQPESGHSSSAKFAEKFAQNKSFCPERHLRSRSCASRLHASCSQTKQTIQPALAVIPTSFCPGRPPFFGHGCLGGAYLATTIGPKAAKISPLKGTTVHDAVSLFSPCTTEVAPSSIVTNTNSGSSTGNTAAKVLIASVSK